MPNDLTIRLSLITPPVEPAPQANATETDKETPVGSALASVVPVNATLALDPAAGVLVIELRNEVGDIVSSIPTAQQLTAYRDAVSHPAVEPASAQDPAKSDETTR